MKWISVNERPPTKEDSPILALDSLDYFSMSALQYIDGWDGAGWYESNGEYGMSLNKDEAWDNRGGKMIYWMPLPEPPNE